MLPTTLVAGTTGTALPRRRGERPRTTTTNPHSQRDQQPSRPWSEEVAAHAASLEGVVLGPSGRAPPGTVGFHLEPDFARGPDRAFLLGREFGHVHPAPDHSLHLTLPPTLRAVAIAAGWAEPHPLAGATSVSADIVMIYAPRDAAELAAVAILVTAAWSYARDLRTQ